MPVPVPYRTTALLRSVHHVGPGFMSITMAGLGRKGSLMTMTRKQQKALDDHAKELRRIADRMRETADGLWWWWKTHEVKERKIGITGGDIHPIHAANRIRKLADELAKEK